MSGTVLRRTVSLCPYCMERIPAAYVQYDKVIYLEKTCPNHGPCQTPVWKGHLDFQTWTGDRPELKLNENPPCPTQCGLCKEHQNDTCCVLLEVTSRCNLHCPFCFADSYPDPDPSLTEISDRLQALAVPGHTLVQLSGGEPTLREDLPEIIRRAKAAGCAFVQLNTNGLRLAEDPHYAKELADAGLSFVFLQFDGTADEIYKTLRGRPLFEEKQKAVRHCGEQGLGVTLVPALLPGVNTHNIGELLDLALSLSPVVRGVHFQPMSYLGRTPHLPHPAERYPLDQLIHDIETQTGGRITAKHLKPSRCDHPLCGFHGDFALFPDGLRPLSTGGSDCCCGSVSAEQNRSFVAKRWTRRASENTGCACETEDYTDMETFVRRVRSHGFTVSAMAFQDPGTLDLDRLRRCSLHVYSDLKWSPFCSHYLKPWKI